MDSDVSTTEIIVDDTNKINGIKKRAKENQTGKLVLNNNNKEKVFILKGSIVKPVQGWEVIKEQKLSYLKDYAKSSIRENNPDHIRLHVGTNDVPSEKTPQVIAQSKVDLAKLRRSIRCTKFCLIYAKTKMFRSSGIVQLTLLYVRNDIPSKLIASRNSTIAGFLIELKLRKKKWLLRRTYNPNRSFISDLLSNIRSNIDLLLANKGNFLLMGDLKVKGHNGFLKVSEYLL